MTDHIRIRPAEGLWVVRTGGAVIAESSAALELSEGDYAPAIYFPRGDVAMAFLERSASGSHSPYMGDASYYTVSSPGETLPDAAWSYESPLPGMEAIAGHIAFYTNRVNVEKL
ncbi:DUF427 domain-containing protein [Rhodobacterales bacterium HKCCE2091]|nr:DUF427 domain-containing protein [Rhodobacterales bacterium HKCCE2091]